MHVMERTIEEVTQGKKVAQWFQDLQRDKGSSLLAGDHYRAAVYRLNRAGTIGGLPSLHKGHEAQAFYIAMRLDGTDHRMAEMFALQTPPMSKSDREFLEGHCNGNQFEGQEYIGDWYAAKAKAAGVDITGKVYMSGLALEPGDPAAWVGGRGDVERVARERGMTVSGMVDYKPDGRLTELALSRGDTRVADDLVESAMLDRIEADPSLALKNTGELFAETRERIAPHWE